MGDDPAIRSPIITCSCTKTNTDGNKPLVPFICSLYASRAGRGVKLTSGSGRLCRSVICDVTNLLAFHFPPSFIYQYPSGYTQVTSSVSNMEMFWNAFICRLSTPTDPDRNRPARLSDYIQSRLKGSSCGNDQHYISTKTYFGNAEKVAYCMK